MMRILLFHSVLIFAFGSIHAKALLCGHASSTARLIGDAEKIEVNIKGTDDRKAQEDFSNPENLEAQRILGLQEIEKSISGVVEVECLYTKDNGKTYRNRFNGILACDNQTLLVNAHSLANSLCNSANENFNCTVQPGQHHPETSKILRPTPSQIMDKDFCDSPNEGKDLVVVKLEQPSSRTPLKIGTVSSFGQIQERKFVSVAANTTKNFVDSRGQRIETEKTFTVSRFDGLTSAQPPLAKSETDGGNGASGEAHLISQDGEPLVIGLRRGFWAPVDENNKPLDGYPYDPNSNYTTSIFFQKEIQDFVRSQVKEPNKCFREVAPENSVSI